MAGAPAPFNPDDPFDGLADLARREVTHAAQRILASPEYRSLCRSPDKQVSAVLIGVLTGACGISIVHLARDDDGHAQIRAWMQSVLPQAFNQARSILDMPPLPEARQ